MTPTSTQVLGGAAAAADVGKATTAVEEDEVDGHEWILDAYRSLEPGNYLREFTNRNVRPDGRTFSSCRPVSVLRSVLVRNSRGSASITLGGGGGPSSSSSSSSITRVVGACHSFLAWTSGDRRLDHGRRRHVSLVGRVHSSVSDTTLLGRRAGTSDRPPSQLSAGVAGGDDDDDNRPTASRRRRPDRFVVASRDDVFDRVFGRDEWRQTIGRLPPSLDRIVDQEDAALCPRISIRPELAIEGGIRAWRVRVSLHLIEDEAFDAVADGDGRRGRNVTVVDDDHATTHYDHDGDGKAGRRPGRRDGRKMGGRSLTLGPVPVPLTVAILPGGADPTALEEDASGGNAITIVCNSGGMIVGLHKGGGGRRCHVSTRQMTAIASMGIGRARELEGSILGERI
ncbi:hypothetical protein ACHAW5_002231 [Stephanodiscus triporus]|uniref:Uncharacterized protein n=1 Tax=Stephanodiscus triporus TaxID=2934178 RepID=A0ABD3QN01_9STRA